MSDAPIEKVPSSGKIAYSNKPEEASPTPNSEVKEQKTLTQVKITPRSRGQEDEVASRALARFANDQEYIRIFYSDYSYSFHAVIGSEDFYLRWVKIGAEAMKIEIAIDRDLKAKKRYWAQVKERFRQELKKISLS